MCQCVPVECRQLTHRSFATPKWLEYTLAYLGTLGNQQVGGA